MPNYDEKTPSGWPLPFRGNTLEFDVERLRESFLAVDESLQNLREKFSDLLNEKYYGLEERQYILDARMDVIAGQTTEDTEILDARVDAEGVTHPNVGHNLRNLHSNILNVGANVLDTFLEFQGLLRQFNELAYAQIQGMLNTQQAYERIDEEVLAREGSDAEIREELAQEASTRNEQDEILQAQADKLSEANLRQSLNAHNERTLREQADENIRSELTHGVDTLTASLREEIDERSRADEVLREALEGEIQTRQTQDEARKFEIAGETVDRAANDEALQLQADKLSEASIQHSLDTLNEAERRRIADEALTAERIQSEQDLQLTIQDEGLGRISDAQAQQGQIDALAEASLRNTLDIQDEALARKHHDDGLHNALIDEAASRLQADNDLRTEFSAALNDEASERASNDDALQAQADKSAEAILRTTLDLHETARKQNDALREGIHSTQQHFDELHTLEVNTREIQGETIQSEIDTLSMGSIRQNLNIHNEAERRRRDNEEIRKETFHNLALVSETIDTETQALIGQDEALQEQADKLSQASIQHSLDIRNEAQHRRIADEALQAQQNTEADIRSQDDYALSEHLDTLAQTALQQSVNLQQEAQFRRSDFRNLNEALEHEAQSRTAQAEILQSEIDILSMGGIRQNLNIHNEAQRRRRDDYAEAIARENADNSDFQEHYSNNSALQKQLDTLAQSAIQEKLHALAVETTHKQQADTLSQAAQQEHSDIQAQLDTLVFAVLRIALNDYEGRDRLRQHIDNLFQDIAENGDFTYMGARVASRSEIADMIADILSGSDTGEISQSEIPEELQDQLATSSEVDDMLAEIFPNYNRS